MNGFDLSEAYDIRLGSNTITAIYYGSTLLWPLAPRDYSKEYLTIKALRDSTVIFYKNSDDISRTIQYSKNKRTWNTISFGNFDYKDIPEAYKVSLLAGEKLYLKGNNSAYCTSDGANYCSINIYEGLADIYGNIMSLIYDDNFYEQTVLNEPYSFSNLFKCALLTNQYIKNASNLILPATTLSTYCYNNMFDGCMLLKSAPELPATTLADYCYAEMFRGCTSLESAPELQATTLSPYCYSYMFSNCKSLTSAPELPATALADGCYAGMFHFCVFLKAPELPATALADGCYSYMFSDCTSLTSAPELPVTTLAEGCYYHMFNRCTSLSSAPELPATTLKYNCYNGMFSGCKKLLIAPYLPATTLEKGCYAYMFDGCTSLTSAPELPATTLYLGCYHGMFIGCTSLSSAPELPATTLKYSCYEEMFRGCVNLAIAPDLPATTLEENCYKYMFYDCNNLIYIKCLAIDVDYNYIKFNSTEDWLNGVSSKGRFIKNPNMSNWTTGTSGIPSGWTVQDA